MAYVPKYGTTSGKPLYNPASALPVYSCNSNFYHLSNCSTGAFAISAQTDLEPYVGGVVVWGGECWLVSRTSTPGGSVVTISEGSATKGCDLCIRSTLTHCVTGVKQIISNDFRNYWNKIVKIGSSCFAVSWMFSTSPGVTVSTPSEVFDTCGKCVDGWSGTDCCPRGTPMSIVVSLVGLRICTGTYCSSSPYFDTVITGIAPPNGSMTLTRHTVGTNHCIYLPEPNPTPVGACINFKRYYPSGVGCGKGEFYGETTLDSITMSDEGVALTNAANNESPIIIFPCSWDYLCEPGMVQQQTPSNPCPSSTGPCVGTIYGGPGAAVIWTPVYS